MGGGDGGVGGGDMFREGLKINVSHLFVVETREENDVFMDNQLWTCNCVQTQIKNTTPPRHPPSHKLFLMSQKYDD